MVVPEYSDRSDLFSDVDNVTVITGKDLTDEETVVDFIRSDFTLGVDPSGGWLYGSCASRYIAHWSICFG